MHLSELSFIFLLLLSWFESRHAICSLCYSLTISLGAWLFSNERREFSGLYDILRIKFNIKKKTSSMLCPSPEDQRGTSKSQQHD